jgi:phosphohistidine phosphatase SixA
MNRARRTVFPWALALLALVPFQRALSQDGPSLVILVRHAEKADVPGNDPPLSAAGQARAKALAEALAHVPVSAVITSSFKRTVQTGALVAQQRNLRAEAIGLDAGTAAHVAAVAAAVRAKSGVVLVVGHSNTVPAILAALGGPRLPDICDASYATMFLLQPAAGTPPLAVAHFGAADPEGAASCPGMQVR